MVEVVRHDLSSIKMSCPTHGGALHVEQAPSGEASQFACESGCSYPIHKGIPRFVSSDMYASSFGLQWNSFRKTQLDSCSGTTISRDRLTRILGGSLDFLKGQNVLEAGCGAGRFTEILLDSGANVFACDISSAVEANYDNCGRLITGSNYFVCQADLRALPLVPVQFDVVVCIGVIQHTPNPEETIQALCAHVKPGGLLVLDHYTYGYATTRSRAALRKLLLQVPPELALEFCHEMTEVLWPAHQFLWENRNDPVIGPMRQAFLDASPIVDYLDSYPQLGDQLKIWGVLDTHDTLTDRFKHLRSADEITKALESQSMKVISIAYDGNGVETRAIKQTTPLVPKHSNSVDLNDATTKIMFLAFGFSIHAKRRISIFTEDPRFDVTVVSNHDYDFVNARNILLNGSTSGLSPEISPDELKKIIDLARLHGIEDLTSLAPELGVGFHDFGILKQAVETFSPDVIFLQTLLYPSYLALFLPRTIPYIVTFWNGDVTWWAQWDGLERACKKEIVTYGALNAAAITVNSQKALQACLEYGVPQEKIHLVRYPGADLERFMPRVRSDAKSRLGMKSRYTVLCPRGLGEYLNADCIIEAASIVCREADVEFVFLSGVGYELWESYQARGQELGIANYLRHDGQITWEQMPLYYNAADVMVSVSSNDSLPNCMLESMASGTPVIMGDIPAIREWVTEDVTGYLVPPRDSARLALKILDVLAASACSVSAVVNNARAQMLKEADSRVNSKKIKELVLLTASQNVCKGSL